MPVRVPFLLTILALSNAACAQGVAPDAARVAKAPGKYRYEIRSEGVTRKFILQVPPDYSPTRPLPMVVALHGWSMSGESFMTYSGFGALGNREQFFVLAPDGTGDPRGWNAGFLDLSGEKHDDAQVVMDMLSRAEKEVAVDGKRTYVVGHSNGAMLAQWIGSRFGDRVAAIASVAGLMGVPGRAGREERAIPAPKTGLSVMLVHGSGDRLVTYRPSDEGLLKGIAAPDAAQWWATSLQIQGKPTAERDPKVVRDWWRGPSGLDVEFVTLLGAGHDWPTQAKTGFDATEEIWRFFRDHPKR